MTARPEKTCATCGRRMSWRKAWARNWESMRHCSAACRGRRPSSLDIELEAAIVSLGRQRGPHKTFCPSEVAKAMRPEGWRPLMERTRRAARRLVAAGKLEILQRGHVVDPSTARGPIRLRLREPMVGRSDPEPTPPSCDRAGGPSSAPVGRRRAHGKTGARRRS
ncbi:MAG: DUF3253 domain-containing protein [Myxococcota bacterium]